MNQALGMRSELGAQARPSRRAGLGWFTPLILVALCTLLARAQEPRFYQPKEHDYNARGTRVTAKWSLDRTTVPEDGHLTATLTITGATNPHEVVRPDLRKLPAFNDRFQIEDVPGKPVPANAKSVSFAYRLRPRARDVNRVPTLPFAYFNPQGGGPNKYRETKADGIDIKVTPAAAKAAPPPPAVPLDAPEFLFEINTGPQVLDRGPFAPGSATWALLVALGPLLAGGWYVAWRRLYPDAVRLARIRRSKAARRAVDAIRRAGRSADPAGTIAAAVLGYLRARYPLPPGAETPTELGDALRAAGLPEADAGPAVAFFRDCDEARFAPPADTGLSLADEAEALVARLEERE